MLRNSTGVEMECNVIFVFLSIARTRYGVCVNFYRRVDQYYLNTPKTSEAGDEEYGETDRKSRPSVFLKW